MTSRPSPGGLIDVLPGALAALSVTGFDATGGDPLGGDPLGLAAELSGVRQIAVLLIDGFGFHLIPEAAQVAPVIDDIHRGRLGHVRRIVCGFPSTTPVSLVGLGTGAPPGGHGVVGFSARVPGAGRVLNHVHWGADPDPETWQPLPTVFQRAAAAGLRSAVVTRPEFDGSGLTRAAYRGAEFHGAAGRHELIAGVVGALGDGIPLVYGYYPRLDHAGHVHGVGSDQWRDAAKAVDQIIAEVSAQLPAGAALLVTADHGQLNIAAEDKLDFDVDERLQAGVAQVAGEARVRYLHVEPGAQADVLAAWSDVLGEPHLVVTRDQAIDEGWYGPVAPEHVVRIGDVITVCQARCAVVRSKAAPGEATLIGYHGAFTPAEADVPLIMVRAGD